MGGRRERMVVFVRGVPEVFTVFIIRFLHSIEYALLKTVIWKITGSISQILLKGNEVIKARNAVGKTKYEIIGKIHFFKKSFFVKHRLMKSCSL